MFTPMQSPWPEQSLTLSQLNKSHALPCQPALHSHVPSGRQLPWPVKDTPKCWTDVTSNLCKRSNTGTEGKVLACSYVTTDSTISIVTQTLIISQTCALMWTVVRTHCCSTTVITYISDDQITVRITDSQLLFQRCLTLDCIDKYQEPCIAHELNWYSY